MKLKKNLIILIFLFTTTTLSILNLNNTSKTYLYFLNLKTEKLTLGSFITFSFLTGFTTSFIFSYLTSSKTENIMLNEERININSKPLQENFTEKDAEINETTNDRPPERDIRDSQPTISVNYRVIKKNNTDVNDVDEEYMDNKYQKYDDWEEFESNW